MKINDHGWQIQILQQLSSDDSEEQQVSSRIFLSSAAACRGATQCFHPEWVRLTLTLTAAPTENHFRKFSQFIRTFTNKIITDR